MALRILGLFVLLALCSVARAQSDFVVPVNSATTGRGIAGAFVRLTCLSGGCGSGTYSQTTDTSGNAQFTGVIAGKYTVTISGQQITSYSYTRDVTAANPSNLNNIIFVDGVTYPTIQAAYNAVPSTGGVVYIPSGSYTMALGSLVVSKPVRFICANPATTVINFTGASGVGFLFNYSTTPSDGDYRDWGSFGVENCQLLGPGGYGPSSSASNAGTAIQVGDSTHAAIGAYFSTILVSGFTAGITWNTTGAASWGTKCDHCTFLSNTQSLFYNNPNGTENAVFDHCVFATFFTNMGTNDVDISGGGAADFVFRDTSFDSTQLAVSTGVVELADTHHEININLGSPNPPINVTGGVLIAHGPKFYNDKTSGLPPYFVTASGGSCCTYVSFDGVYATTAATMAHEFSISGQVFGSIRMAARQGSFSGSDVLWTSAQAGYIQDASESIVQLDSSYEAPALVISPVPPTVSSGFGTSPCIGASSSGSTCSGTVNNSASFQINVGSGGTANTGFIAMNGSPAPQNGWNCTFTDLTTHSNFPQQIASGSSTTVVEVGGFNSAGSATAWGANDVLNAVCIGR